jgi:branched-chain amino acid transport system ATP-binding protein
MFFQTEGLTKFFGGLAAVSQFDMKVDQGAIIGLIGPNGAGKSTLFNLITGVFPPTRGRVVFEGKEITRAKPHRIAGLGIGRTFQLNPLFGDFTVLENVTAAGHVHYRSSLMSVYFNTGTFRRNQKAILDKSLETLDMVGLSHVKDEPARNLPHGYQKMLGVARALATGPKLLLLDEPLGGMNPEEIDFTLRAISRTRMEGITILIVEHNMQILALCDRVVVINFGRKLAEGPPCEVRDNKEVRVAYFGSGHAAGC